MEGQFRARLKPQRSQIPAVFDFAAIGRIGFGALVALIAYAIQFVYYEPNGPILALFIAAPLVPLIDAIARGYVYRWDQPAAKPAGHFKGVY